MTSLSKRTINRLFLPVFAIFFLLSCQKDMNDLDTGSGGGIIPDLQTTVASSVSGFVTDENNAPAIGASVMAGTSTTTTDKYGYFEIKNAQVVKDAAVITVTKAGYFKGIKTFIGKNNKAAFFRIKLLPKTAAGMISATTGGSVSLSNGLIVALPANGVVVASGNSAYTGNVHVAAHWIDPTAADLNMIMPGDLRGINTAGAIKRLTSYGMVAVELTGDAGELLQIAPGKKATLTFPIPAAIMATAASTIPLWSFDETKGLWKEEGQATQTGNTYVGEVSHFSFWNCDVPANYVEFDCTVLDQTGMPIPYTAVKISIVGGGPYDARYGFTDSLGYVNGLIPDNASLLHEIFTNYNCGTPVYTQNFTTSNTPVSLGTITITNNQYLANVTGTVTDCSSNPVTNGYVIVSENGNYYYSRYPLSSTGTYNFNKLMCSNTTTVTMIAEDLNNAVQSPAQTQTITSGTNIVPNIIACGTSISQFITWSLDGAAAITLTPPDSIQQYVSTGSSSIYITGSGPSSSNYINFSYSETGIGVGSTQVLQSLYLSQFTNQNTTVVSAQVLHITEYGAIGEFIAGNFNATVLDHITSISHDVVCSFRVRRSF